MSCSTSACGRRSALTLKYDNSRVIFSLNVGRLPCGAVVAAVCVDEIGEASCCRVSLSFRGWGEAMESLLVGVVLFILILRVTRGECSLSDIRQTKPVVSSEILAVILCRYRIIINYAV